MSFKKQCLSNTVGEHFWSKAFWVKNPGIAMKKKDSFSFCRRQSVSECSLKRYSKNYGIKCGTSKMDSFKVVGSIKNAKNEVLPSINSSHEMSLNEYYIHIIHMISWKGQASEIPTQFCKYSAMICRCGCCGCG